MYVRDTGDRCGRERYRETRGRNTAKQQALDLTVDYITLRKHARSEQKVRVRQAIFTQASRRQNFDVTRIDVKNGLYPFWGILHWVPC